jgi:hypothetical protein
MANNYRRPLDKDEYKTETEVVVTGTKNGKWVDELKKSNPKDFSGPLGGKASIANVDPDNTYVVSTKRENIGQAMAKAIVKNMENGVLTKRHPDNQNNAGKRK